MPFYDNYFSRSAGISAVGAKIIKREVLNRIVRAQTLSGSQRLKTLELGPGKGHFAKTVLARGWDYCAVDGSPAVVRLLQEQGIEVVQAFVPPVPSEVGDGYQLVLMEHFIEHMDSSVSARQLMESIYQVLNPAGLAFIVSPDYLSHRSNFWDCDYTHSFVTTTQRLSQLLMDTGFEVCYTGSETLGIENSFLTWLISELTQVLFFARLPQILSLVLSGSSQKSQKWKNVLLRSCVVVGQKPGLNTT